MARRPYLQGLGQMFQPLKPIKVLKQERSQSTTNGTNKKAKKSSLSLFASITNLENENGCGARGYPLFGAWDHSPYSAHWAYKGCYLSPGENQAYAVLWNLQEYYGSPGRLVVTVIELLELPLQG